MNRIDPDLFMDCFTSWVAECWPDELVPMMRIATTNKTIVRRLREQPRSFVPGPPASGDALAPYARKSSALTSCARWHWRLTGNRDIAKVKAAQELADVQTS